MSANAIDTKIASARRRKEEGQREIDEGSRELGECFDQVIRHDLDLKAHARLANISRTTAYALAEKFPSTDEASDDRRHRDRYGRWIRVGAVGEITVSQSHPIQIDKGERFRIAEVDDDGSVVQKSLDMYIRHAPGKFKIVSPPTKAEARELTRKKKGSARRQRPSSPKKGVQNGRR